MCWLLIGKYQVYIYGSINVDYFKIAKTLFEEASFVVCCFVAFKRVHLCSGKPDGHLHDVRDVPTRTIIPMNHVRIGNR